VTKSKSVRRSVKTVFEGTWLRRTGEQRPKQRGSPSSAAELKKFQYKKKTTKGGDFYKYDIFRNLRKKANEVGPPTEGWRGGNTGGTQTNYGERGRGCSVGETATLEGTQARVLIKTVYEGKKTLYACENAGGL